MKHLIAFRHAPVESAGLCYGQLDLPSRMPEADAADLVHSQLGTLQPHTVWSSPASRCCLPARLLAQRMRLPHRVDAQVSELSFGSWEGLLWDDIDSTSLTHWMADWIRRAPPGGESTRCLERRVSSWWNALEDGAHLLIAHAGVVKALEVVVRGLTWDEAMKLEVLHLDPIEFRTQAVGLDSD